MAKAGAGFFVDLLSRIVSGIRGAVIAPLALTFGCSTQPSDASDKPVPPQPEVIAKPAPVVDEGPKQLGFFSITFYYVIGEDEVTAKANEARAGERQRRHRDRARRGHPAREGDHLREERVRADRRRHPRLRRPARAAGDRQAPRRPRPQHLGPVQLRHGRPASRSPPQQWGTAGSGRPLQPFRTVAVDPKLIKLGSLLYVPLLEGRTMPGRAPWGGFVHDGCVVADDTGGGINGKQLDLFVGARPGSSGWPPRAAAAAMPGRATFRSTTAARSASARAATSRASPAASSVLNSPFSFSVPYW